MSIANLFRLGRLWIEHFGQLTDITINVICERNDFDRRSNSRQNRFIYKYMYAYVQYMYMWPHET